MTGHGGDGFLKFQDSEEISSIELADAFEQMWQKQRWHMIGVKIFIFLLFFKKVRLKGYGNIFFDWLIAKNY